MDISLEQLLKQYGVSAEQRKRCSVVCHPQQKDFVSLIQWFGDDKILPSSFNIEQFNVGYMLVPYGTNIYGIYPNNNRTLYSTQGCLNTNFDGDRQNLGSPLCIIKYNKEEYQRVKEEYDKFWEWKKNRNPARLEMELEFSYDGKHAMHLVRLLRMGQEILETGQVIVNRPDAQELLDIRNGSMKYEDVVKYAEMIDNHIRNNLYKTTSLPKKPDIKTAARILMTAQNMVWDTNYE